MVSKIIDFFFVTELLTKFTKYVIGPYYVTGTGIREGTTKVEICFFVFFFFFPWVTLAKGEKDR